MKQALKHWAIGNIVLLSVLGTSNIVAFSAYDVAAKVEIVRTSPIPESELKLAQQIHDNGITDVNKLCSVKKG